MDDCGEWVCRSCGWGSPTWWARCRRCRSDYTLEYEAQACDEEEAQ
jgi:ribosomal protein L40E